jgi:hypothetical protein
MENASILRKSGTENSKRIVRRQVVAGSVATRPAVCRCKECTCGDACTCGVSVLVPILEKAEVALATGRCKQSKNHERNIQGRGRGGGGGMGMKAVRVARCRATRALT